MLPWRATEDGFVTREVLDWYGRFADGLPGERGWIVLGGGARPGERKQLVVVVDKVSLPFLENAVIDFTEELIGARFTIENPNATSSCGCGTSFSM